MPHVQMSLKINSLLEVLLPESLIKGRCVPNWPLHIEVTFSTFEEFSFWNWSHLQGASLHYNSICKSECKIAMAPKGLKIWWINNVEKKHYPPVLSTTIQEGSSSKASKRNLHGIIFYVQSVFIYLQIIVDYLD